MLKYTEFCSQFKENWLDENRLILEHPLAGTFRVLKVGTKLVIEIERDTLEIMVDSLETFYARVYTAYVETYEG